jgi:hypothetical protein
VKIAFFAIVLMGIVLFAAPYFGFNPVLPFLALLAVGIYGVCRRAPALTWRDGGHWGSGHGIYFDHDDNWVSGRDSDAPYNANDGAPRERAGKDRGTG